MQERIAEVREKIYLTADQITPVSIEVQCQETAINYLRNDLMASISVTDNTTLTKLRKLVAKDPDHYKCYAASYDPATGAANSYIFEIPKKCISFRTVPPKKELTDEQRKAYVERMHQAHKKEMKGQKL